MTSPRSAPPPSDGASRGMQVYCVGGAVRDELLGVPVADRDYVVVGATPEQMVELGFRPVGKDFPVFLHPRTHEEYALARTERKSGRGYRGFTVYSAPDVTLEQDLVRRDLTINAMARDQDGRLIDPFGGEADLRAGVLRHVGNSFVEDPVRVLRVARFAARYEFTIAAQTMELMRAMTAAGEVDHLVAERVWQEMARGLMERAPQRFLTTLRKCGALARVLPEVDALFGVPQPAEHHPEIDTGEHVLLVLHETARSGQPLDVRFAALVHDLGKAATPAAELPRHIAHERRSLPLIEALCARLRVPSDCRELALLAARHHTTVHRALELRPATIVELFEHSDLFRRRERFERLLAVAQCDAHGRAGRASADYPQVAHLRRAAAAALAVDAGAVAKATADPAHIREHVRVARIDAVRHALRDQPRS